MKPVPVLTIDGPSGSGKGTIAQIIAGRLGWHFLDSGALYRLLALAAVKARVPLSDGAALAKLSQAVEIRFVPRPGDVSGVMLNGEEVGDEIRTESAGEGASLVAAIPEVRAALLQKQHDFRKLPGLVADGRDMGTTVFPDALLKVFLTASAEVRADRRYKQLKEKGFDVNLARLLGEIRERDQRDAARPVSPLKPADDAIVLDCSQLSINEVVDRISGLLAGRVSRAT